MRPSRHLVTCVASLALFVVALAGVPAGAKTFCVGTVAELDDAFAQAHGYDAVAIRVKTGSYLLDRTLESEADTSFFPYGTYLLFSGGWDTSCKHQTPNAGLTVLNGHGDHGISLRKEFVVQFDNMTLFLMGPSIVELAPSSTQPGPEVTARNLAVVHSGGFRVEGDVELDCDPKIVKVWIGSSLFVQSTESTAVEVTFCAGEVRLDQVTVASNSGLGVMVHSTSESIWDPFAISVTDSIFFDNGQPLKLTSDMNEPYMPGAMIEFFEGNVGQDFWSVYGNGYGVGNNLAADPLLGSDFRPQLGSPAIDFGRTPDELWGIGTAWNLRSWGPPSDFDVAGKNRFVGSRPDAGAFEQPPRCGK